MRRKSSLISFHRANYAIRMKFLEIKKYRCFDYRFCYLHVVLANFSAPLNG